ncbi:hypothetical protein CA54_20260 [Symmachiella macrocystis]|uniref:Double zinc ribbon n=1 Tax=Symmachiella macrocystis TaxID=2527985 RepID=A0A5C6BR98_9PLAN|nr:hypothetical protein [Symmachiella macrocystis]TWU13194.1 hypothetical protein CA54_20260 [Symmachiella macrocystis]
METTTLCERCETPLESGDLRCSICGQAAPLREELRRDVAVQILRCTGCGAAVAYDPAHQAPACSFCGAVMQVETQEDPLEQSQGYLPFTVDQDQARKSLRHWLGTLGWFRPDSLKSAAKIEELTPIWWVGWVFDAEAHVCWAGDSNVDAGRSAWAPHAGETAMNFDDILVSASRGLTKQEVDVVAPGCDLSSVVDQPQGPAGATIEQFDLQRSQARQQIVYTIRQLADSRAANEHIPGTNSRNVKASVILRKLVTRRYSFPAYVLAYRYQDRLYRVVICGQDARRLTGSAPYSIPKILLAAAAAAAALLVVAGIVLSAQ